MVDFAARDTISTLRTVLLYGYLSWRVSGCFVTRRGRCQVHSVRGASVARRLLRLLQVSCAAVRTWVSDGRRRHSLSELLQRGLVIITAFWLSDAAPMIVYRVTDNEDSDNEERQVSSSFWGVESHCLCPSVQTLSAFRSFPGRRCRCRAFLRGWIRLSPAIPFAAGATTAANPRKTNPKVDRPSPAYFPVAVPCCSSSHGSCRNIRWQLDIETLRRMYLGGAERRPLCPLSPVLRRSWLDDWKSIRSVKNSASALSRTRPQAVVTTTNRLQFDRATTFRRPMSTWPGCCAAA